MNRAEKAEFIGEMKERFASSSLVALTEFKGATVAEIENVRRTFGAAGIHFRVVKNTLCRKAVEGTDKEPLASQFRGNVAVFFSGDDGIGAAKLIRDQLRDKEKFVVKAGFFDGQMLDAKGVEAVATLPSREELLSTLLATLQAGPQEVLGVLQAPARDLLFLLTNFGAELEKSA